MCVQSQDKMGAVVPDDGGMLLNYNQPRFVYFTAINIASRTNWLLVGVDMLSFRRNWGLIPLETSGKTRGLFTQIAWCEGGVRRYVPRYVACFDYLRRHQLGSFASSGGRAQVSDPQA